MQARHSDPFGSEAFGPWDTEALLYWFIRLLVLTGPTSPRSAIRVNEEALAQSVDIVDREGRVIGGAFNDTMPPLDVDPGLRQDVPFMAAVLATRSSSPGWKRRYARARVVYAASC